MPLRFHCSMSIQHSRSRPQKSGYRARQKAMSLLIAGLALCNGASVSTAQTQFSTLGGAYQALYPIGLEYMWGVAFVTDSNVYTLNSITLRANSGSSTPVTFTGWLYPDFWNLSTLPLEQLGGSTTITTPNSLTDLRFTSTGAVLLANTRYAAVFCSDPAAYVISYGSWHADGPWAHGWEFLYSQAAYSSDGGVSWGYTSPPLAFSVDASIVPEPSPLALVFLGVVCMALAGGQRAETNSGRTLPNTGPNAGGLRQFPIRMSLTARVGQFSRSVTHMPEH
jgi:hypothetical protein